jgi:hypothetical protein
LLHQFLPQFQKKPQRTPRLDRFDGFAIDARGSARLRRTCSHANHNTSKLQTLKNRTPMECPYLTKRK